MKITLLSQQIWDGRRISELEDRSIKIIKSENREKQDLKRNGQKLTDLWDTIKFQQTYTEIIKRRDRKN